VGAVACKDGYAKRFHMERLDQDKRQGNDHLFL